MGKRTIPRTVLPCDFNLLLWLDRMAEVIFKISDWPWYDRQATSKTELLLKYFGQIHVLYRTCCSLRFYLDSSRCIIIILKMLLSRALEALVANFHQLPSWGSLICLCSHVVGLGELRLRRSLVVIVAPSRAGWSHRVRSHLHRLVILSVAHLLGFWLPLLFGCNWLDHNFGSLLLASGSLVVGRWLFLVRLPTYTFDQQVLVILAAAGLISYFQRLRPLFLVVMLYFLIAHLRLAQITISAIQGLGVELDLISSQYIIKSIVRQHALISRCLQIGRRLLRADCWFRFLKLYLPRVVHCLLGCVQHIPIDGVLLVGQVQLKHIFVVLLNSSIQVKARFVLWILFPDLLIFVLYNLEILRVFVVAASEPWFLSRHDESFIGLSFDPAENCLILWLTLVTLMSPRSFHQMTLGLSICPVYSWAHLWHG